MVKGVVKVVAHRIVEPGLAVEPAAGWQEISLEKAEMPLRSEESHRQPDEESDSSAEVPCWIQ